MRPSVAIRMETKDTARPKSLKGSTMSRWAAIMTEAINRFPYFRILIGLITASAVAFLLIYIVPSVIFLVLILSHGSKVTEFQRAKSPDQLLDSVVMEIQPGFSIESHGYRVYITTAGSNHLENPVLEAENVKNLKVTWLAPKLLQISYTDGCIDTFRNHWSNGKVNNGLDNVEVRIRLPDNATPRRCD